LVVGDIEGLVEGLVVGLLEGPPKDVRKVSRAVG